MTDIPPDYKYCHKNNNVNIIEDEYHFISMCPLHTAERSYYIQSWLFQPSLSRFFY